MVTIAPKEKDYSDVGQLFGSGASQGYQNRADEMALQKAIMDLGDNPPADKLMQTILGTKTYNPQSKQNLFQNLMGIEQFKEAQRHAKESEEIAKGKVTAKNEIEAAKKAVEDEKEKAKKQADMNDALTLIDSAKIPHEEKRVLRQKVENGEASFNAIKEVLKPNKEEIKNKEEEKAQKLTQRAFNEIVSLIPDVGTLKLPESKIGGKTASAYSKFTSLTGALEALLVEKVNRGALSNTRFKYITETLLPKPSDTQADIKGKLEGLATILDLDPSVLTGKQRTEEKQEGVSTENKRPPLTSFERK